MERHKSALKAARQAVKRTARNTAALSKVKTTVKKLRTAMTNKAEKKNLPALLNEVQRTLTKAASKKLMKRETAQRQIGRLSTAVHRALNA